MTLLERIKSLMDAEGITASQLTNELGLSNSSFTDWKKGKGSPSLDAVMKISKRFDVSLDYLVYGSDSSKVKLEFSNPLDGELLEKFHRLQKDMQMKLIGYVDGLLLSSSEAATDEKRLSV